MENASRVSRRSRIWVAASVLLVAAGASASAPDGRYTVTAETVTDGATSLVWQRNVGAQPQSWAGAMAYCSSLALGGWSSGWRLPTIKELQTIVDVRVFDPAVDATAFPSTPADYFWTSTPDAEFPSYSWAITFSTGDTLIGDANNSAFARCVR